MQKTIDEPKARPDVGCTELLGAVADKCKECTRECTAKCQYHVDYWKQAARQTAEFLLERFEPRACDCEAVSHCERCAVVATARWMLDKVLKLNADLEPARKEG